MKTCKACNVSKELTEFYKDKETKDGYINKCKACKDQRNIAWRKDNKDKWNAYMREFNAEHPLSIADKRQKASRTLKHRYGITMDEYDAMLASQGGGCKICGKGMFEQKVRFCVDHCHVTGKVRGILCGGCNSAIAILDNPILLAQAQAYLVK